MLNRLISILLFSLVLVITGCATLFGDNERKVTINSNPTGASVYLNGNLRGATPMILILPTYIYNGADVTLKKEGYYDTTVALNVKFQTVGLWNILNSGFGFLIDGATGSFVKIDPNDLSQSINLSTVAKK
jgi:hypothetical protein